MIDRYIFKDSRTANILHNQYTGTYIENIFDHFPAVLNSVHKRLFPKKTVKKTKSYLRHYIRTMDPSMSHASVMADASQDINYADVYDIYRKHYPKNFIEEIQSLTIPGRMLRTIEYAVKNKNKQYPEKGLHSQNISTYANPFNELFNQTFAKDLLQIVPHWCTLELNDAEQAELLEYYVKKNGRWPSSRNDQWVFPSTHKLATAKKLGYKIKPNILYYAKKAKPKQPLILAEMEMKKGSIPSNLPSLKYNFPKELKTLWKKYPDIYCLTQEGRALMAGSTLKKIKENPSTVGKFDMELLTTWEKIEKIVDKWDFKDLESYVKVDGHTRMMIGNSLKFINARYKFNKNKIILAEVDRIRNKIKEKIPAIVRIYTHKQGRELYKKARYKHDYKRKKR